MNRSEFKSEHNINGIGVTMLSHHNGSSMHKFTVDQSITEDQACEIQMKMGYHPAGYGFYAFESNVKETSWKCGDSCD